LRWVILIYIGLPIRNCVHDHIWSKNKWTAMQFDGSWHERKRLKYKQDSIVCPQSYPSSSTLSISSRKVKYTTDTEPRLLFGNITDPNKSMKNAHMYLKKNKNLIKLIINSHLSKIYNKNYTVGQSYHRSRQIILENASANMKVGYYTSRTEHTRSLFPCSLSWMATNYQWCRHSCKNQHPTQGASPTSCSIHYQLPMLLVFLYFLYFQIRLVNFKNNI
jgi:hypothetical protein